MLKVAPVAPEYAVAIIVLFEPMLLGSVHVAVVAYS
jgi:hypothetical protein